MEKALVIWEYDNPHDNVLTRFRQLIRSAEQGFTLLGYGASGATITTEELTTRAAKSLHQAAVPGRLHCSSADTLEEDIFAAVNAENYDILIKSHELEASSPWHANLDSRLLRELSLPLLVCANHKRKSANAILATVDIASDDPLQDRINRQVLTAANELAHTLQKDLHVAYVIAISRVNVEFEFSDPLSLVRKHSATVTEKLRQLLGQLGIETSCLHISAGLPETEIKDIAKNVRADLVVVGSIGRKGLKSLFPGNTAERMFKSLRRDLLILKPQSAESD